MSTTRTWTDAELMALPKDGWKRELVDGEIVMSPAGAPHGRVIVRLIVRLETHVQAHGLGHVFESSTGVRMPSENLRVPDICFVSRTKLPREPEPGFLRVIPDLVVEVLSPGDSPRGVFDKVGEYLAAGVRLVWLIDPERRAAACHRSITDVRVIDATGDLDGEDVVPGFRCALATLLDG